MFGDFRKKMSIAGNLATMKQGIKPLFIKIMDSDCVVTIP